MAEGNSAVERTELALNIAESIERFLRNYSGRRNLDRKKIIRTLLRHLKFENPEYNVVVIEHGCGFYTDLIDNIYKQEIELQDLITKFKFEILLFKKGTLSVIHGVEDVKRWGCLGNIDWNKVKFIDATGANIFVFDEPDITRVYEIKPRSR
jgi:hypothetical protein